MGLIIPVLRDREDIPEDLKAPDHITRIAPEAPVAVMADREITTDRAGIPDRVEATDPVDIPRRADRVGIKDPADRPDFPDRADRPVFPDRADRVDIRGRADRADFPDRAVVVAFQDLERTAAADSEAQDREADLLNPMTMIIMAPEVQVVQKAL
jgi:hypothetical protein